MDYNDLENWKKTKRGMASSEPLEFYEDTHDENGNYIGNSSIFPNIQTSPEKSRGLFGRSGRKKDAAQDDYTQDFASSNFKPQQNTDPSNTKTNEKDKQNKGQFAKFIVSEFEDVKKIIAFLQKKEPCIVNLNGIDPNIARRALDYLSGANYALNGTIERVSPSNIFLFLPEDVQMYSY